MSEHDEVPVPSEELRAFFTEHAETGEPSPAELARLKSRIVAAPEPKVVPLAPRRPLLRSEWMAAAAVLALVVALQGAWWLYKSRQGPSEAEQKQLDAITQAYREGDLDGAQHLASASCSAAACQALQGSLEKAKALSQRLEGLSPEELQELGTLDAELSQGAPSPLSGKVTEQKVKTGVPPQLRAAAKDAWAQASALLQASRALEAKPALEACLAADPGFAPCLLAMADLSSALADRDASQLALAQELYGRYLRVAGNEGADARRALAFLDAHPSKGTALYELRPSEPQPSAVPLNGPTPAQLHEEAYAFKRKQEYEQAAMRLEKCIAIDPNFAQCHRLLGSVYASIATRDQSAKDMEKARRAYERFLQVAPPDDEYVPKVRAILEQSRVVGQSVPDLVAGAERAAAARQWSEATRMARLALISAPDDAAARKVLDDARAVAKDAYLRGYQLKDADPVQARRWFTEVLQATSSDDELFQKATIRLKELGDAAPLPQLLGGSGATVRDMVGGGSVTVLRGGTGVVRPGALIQRAAVGDASIADVTSGPSELTVKGLAPGKTTLLIWLASGQRQSWLIEVK